MKRIRCVSFKFRISLRTKDRKTFSFSFPRWNQTDRVKIYRNKQLVTDEVEINYFKGTITFDNELLPQDIIHADYDFRWFSDDQIDVFLNMALLAFNSYPPVKGYSLTNVPSHYIPAVLYGAARDALRNILLGNVNFLL